jgi:hypothetical protein
VNLFVMKRHGVGCLLTMLLIAGCSDDIGSGNGGSSGSGGGSGASGSAGVGGSSGSGGGSGGGTGGSAGSSGGSGGTAGSGATGGSAGATAGCSPDFLLCEDFESTAVGATPAGWQQHGEASVADDQAKAGTHSLKISPADNGQRRIYHSAEMVGAAHWGRVYYRVQLPVPDAFVHSTIVTFHGVGPTVGEAEFRFVDTVKDQKTGGFADGKHQFLYNVQPNGPEFGVGGNYDYEFDGAWHCAEWHVDAADQSYQFYYEGTEVIAFTNGAGNYEDSELPTSFSEVRLGWNNYQSAPPGFTAWIDEFVVDDQRVGCLP